MDRKALNAAKKRLLSELLKTPDWEKTTSDVELEAALMNDSEVNVCFLSTREKAKNGIGALDEPENRANVQQEKLKPRVSGSTCLSSGVQDAAPSKVADYRSRS
jgi:hypothetical protein